MQIINLSLDDIEAAQLQRFSSVNKLTPEQAAAILVHERLQEWVDQLILTEDDNGKRH